MQRKPLWLSSLFAFSLLTLPGCGSDEADAAGSCTIVDLGNGKSAIRCPDAPDLVVENGKDGAPGLKGEDGKDGKGGLEGEDGKVAPPCSLAENADGKFTLSCGDKSVVIGDDCEDGFQGNLYVTSPGSSFHDSSLTLFQATSCKWIRGSVYVDGYAEKALPRSLARIERIDGNLSVGFDDGNGELESVSFPNLKTVGMALDFSWNGALIEIGDFPELEEVGGGIVIDTHWELRKIGNFPRLTSVERLEFRIGPKLESIGSFDELVSTGSLEWYWLDSLTDMGSFPRLERAATFNFGGNHAMTSLADFPALETIEGSSAFWFAVEIWDNAKLASIGGLENVASVGGRVYIADNPELPQSDVDDFLDGIEIDGEKTSCGNKGGTACP